MKQGTELIYPPLLAGAPPLKQSFHQPHQIGHLAASKTSHEWQDLPVQDTIQAGDRVEFHAFLALVWLRNLTLTEVIDFFNPFTLAHLFSVGWLVHTKHPIQTL